MNPFGQAAALRDKLAQQISPYVSPAFSQSDTIVHTFRHSGRFPNNERLPVLHYPGAFTLPYSGADDFIENLFAQHGWSNVWKGVIYDFHHYHSTAHEVLGVYSGRAEVVLGGESGKIFKFTRGDVVVIPAGVAHKMLEQSVDFRTVGAYDAGAEWDILRGEPGEQRAAEQRILRLPLPKKDPVFGDFGPVITFWRDAVPVPKDLEPQMSKGTSSGL